MQKRNVCKNSTPSRNEFLISRNQCVLTSGVVESERRGRRLGWLKREEQELQKRITEEEAEEKMIQEQRAQEESDAKLRESDLRRIRKARGKPFEASTMVHRRRRTKAKKPRGKASKQSTTKRRNRR